MPRALLIAGQAPGSEPRERLWPGLAIAGIVLLGTAVRLYQANYNFDGDEIFSVKTAANRFAEVVSLSLPDTRHPPLHILLLHFWISLFGTSELAARSLSVLFSTGFLVTSYVLLCRLVSRWIALSVLLLLAISPFFVYYGQQARPYALVFLLSAANMLAYFRVLENSDDRRRVLVWAASCALLVYAQYLAILLVGLEIVVALVYMKSGSLRLIAYGVAAALSVLPWAAAAMGSSLSVGADPLRLWIPPPTPRDLAWFYTDLFGAAGGLVAARWLGILLVVVLSAYAIDVIRRRQLPASQLFLLLLAVCVPVFCYVVSAWGPEPVWAGRQMASAAFAFCVIIALGLDVLPRSLAACFILALIIWTAVSLPQAFPQNAKPPWREAARAIDARYGSAEVFADESWVADSLAYYRRKGPVRYWDQNADARNLQRSLAVCRLERCQAFESEALKLRRSLLATWTWGGAGKNQLRLYELCGPLNAALCGQHAARDAEPRFAFQPGRR